MSTREDMIRVEGCELVERMRDQTWRVRLPNGHEVIAKPKGTMRRMGKPNRPFNDMGDRVTVELSPYDLNRGRIVWNESRGQRRRPMR